MATQVTFSDLDYQGREDATSAILVYEGVDQDKAVSNSMIAWLSSKAGDYIYQPTVGGPLDVIIMKLITQDKTEEVRNYFQNILDSNYGGVLEVDTIIVEPDITERQFNIEISYRSLLTNNNNLVLFSTKAPQGSNIPEFSDVPYIGQNLLNFVEQKLPVLPGVMMTFDEVNSVYQWGPYRFINLKNTDSNFNTILRLTQGR